MSQQDALDLNITDRVNMSLGLALSEKWQELVRMNKSDMFNSTKLYYKEPYVFTDQKQSLRNGINVLGKLGADHTVIAHVQLYLPSHYEIRCILYTIKYSPPFYFWPFCPRFWANLTLGEFQCLKSSLRKHKRV